MSKIIDEKEVFRGLIERDVGNLYTSIRETALSMLPNQFKGIAVQYLKIAEPAWIGKLQEKVNLLVDSCFIDDSTTVEQATAKANEMINATLSQWICEKLNLPDDVVSVVLNYSLEK